MTKRQQNQTRAQLQTLTLIELEELAVQTDSMKDFDSIQEVISQKRLELNKHREPVSRFRR